LKPERWGSPLVQEKYQEEKACDKRHPYRIIIIIIIIIIVVVVVVVVVPFSYSNVGRKIFQNDVLNNLTPRIWY